MTDSEQSKVFMFDDSDPQMQEAYRNARRTFRYFWREIAWERRRIVPALDLAFVKAPFSDGEATDSAEDHPDVEQMWLDQIDFDGRLVSGVLLNTPNWLKSVSAGDSVQIPLAEITDWMYGINGVVHGAYTVNLMRSRMGARERSEHDKAWGLNFGDPNRIRVLPEKKKSGGLLKTLFGRGSAEEQADLTAEHPMSEGMAMKLQENLAQDPSMVHTKDDRGWTFLHQEALAGNLATVQVLLEHGADPNATTSHGLTPLQLAQSLGWDRVVSLLRTKGAK